MLNVREPYNWTWTLNRSASYLHWPTVTISFPLQQVTVALESAPTGPHSVASTAGAVLGFEIPQAYLFWIRTSDGLQNAVSEDCPKAVCRRDCAERAEDSASACQQLSDDMKWCHLVFLALLLGLGRSHANLEAMTFEVFLSVQTVATNIAKEAS